MTPEERAAYARMVMGYGLGPTTDNTRAGIPNPEARSYEPTPGENAGLMTRQAIGGTTGDRVEPMVRALLDYGPEPAKAYVDQFSKATDAGRDAMIDPSAANIGNAAVQTGAFLMRPSAMVAGGALGFGDALMKDLGVTGTSPAEAAGKRRQAPAAAETPDLPGLEPEEQAAYKAAVKELANPEWMRREARQALKERVAGFEKRAADRAEGQRRLQEESGRAKQQAEQGEYDRRVQMAEVLRDKELGRDKRFSDTATGQFYEKSGGMAPVIAALGMGGLGRLAHGPAGGKALSYAEGVLGAGLGLNAKDLYEGFATQTENPERRAMEAYGRELPAGHPRKQESMEAAAGMPEVNPTQKAALEKLRDPTTLGIRAGLMALEGTAGPMGAGLVNAPRRIGREIAEDGLFGSKERAQREGMAAALRPTPPPVPSPAGIPAPPAGGLPAAPSTTAQIAPHPVGPQPPAQQATPTSSGRSPASQSSASKAPAYGPEHTDVSRTVITDYLRTGKIPDAKQMRDDISAAIEQAGLPKVTDATLTKKVKDTEGLVQALRGMPPENQKAALDAVLGKGRFLSVPAAAGLGATMTDEDRQAMAKALLNF